MENGFDIGYLKRLSERKINERNNCTPKHINKTSNIHLIKRSDKGLVLISDIPHLIYEYMRPAIENFNINSLTTRGFNYKYWIKYYIFTTYYASKLSEDEFMSDAPFRDNDEVGLLAKNRQGFTFTYNLESALDYFYAEFRDMFRLNRCGGHNKVDRLPLWYGERNPRQLKEELKRLNPGKNILARDLVFDTTRIKVPITYKKQTVMRKQPDGDVREVVETYIEYRNEHGRPVIVTPDNARMEYKIHVNNLVMTEEQQSVIGEVAEAAKDSIEYPGGLTPNMLKKYMTKGNVKRKVKDPTRVITKKDLDDKVIDSASDAPGIDAEALKRLMEKASKK